MGRNLTKRDDMQSPSPQSVLWYEKVVRGANTAEVEEEEEEDRTCAVYRKPRGSGLERSKRRRWWRLFSNYFRFSRVQFLQRFARETEENLSYLSNINFHLRHDSFLASFPGSAT